MCLISLAYQVDPEYPLIVIANRDEFLDRPSTPAHFWPNTHVLAGKDLKAGGTWMGLTQKGRFAAITNYRNPTEKQGAISRGELVSNFLTSQRPSEGYLQQLEATTDDYSGYNLIFGEPSKLLYFSNRGKGAEELSSGIHGLSNHLLNTPWPKVTAINTDLAEWVGYPSHQRTTEDLFRILANADRADDHQLPNTGIPYPIEKALSARHIQLPHYATRTATVLLIDKRGKAEFFERTFIYPDAATDTSQDKEKLWNSHINSAMATENQINWVTRMFSFKLTTAEPKLL